MSYIGKTPIVGNFQKCDALTASATADYTLQVSSTNVVPESANHMLVSLNGILQAPITSFTVSGSTLSFASALTSSDSIDFVILLGNVLDIGTPSDGTVTNAKLAQDIISGETELAAIPDTTDEFLISNAGVLNRIDAQFFQNTPAFYVSLTSNQTISTSTLTTVEFDDEILDSDGTYDTSTYRFTPAVAGTYYFYTRMRSDTGSDNNQIQSAALRKNGTIIERSYVNTGTGAKTDNETTGLSVIVPSVNTTDYFDMQIYITDTSGSPSVVGQGSGVHYSTFGGYKLIG